MKYIVNSLFLSIIGFKSLYYNTTYIKKNIIVKDKFLLHSYNKNFYMISDINDNIYSIKNEWWKLKFNQVENWNKLECNQIYTIYGYGIRLKYFDIYPSILNIKLIK